MKGSFDIRLGEADGAGFPRTDFFPIGTQEFSLRFHQKVLADDDGAETTELVLPEGLNFALVQPSGQWNFDCIRCIERLVSSSSRHELLAGRLSYEAVEYIDWLCMAYP